MWCSAGRSGWAGGELRRRLPGPIGFAAIHRTELPSSAVRNQACPVPSTLPDAPPALTEPSVAGSRMTTVFSSTAIPEVASPAATVATSRERVPHWLVCTSTVDEISPSPSTTVTWSRSSALSSCVTAVEPSRHPPSRARCGAIIAPAENPAYGTPSAHGGTDRDRRAAGAPGGKRGAVRRRRAARRGLRRTSRPGSSRRSSRRGSSWSSAAVAGSTAISPDRARACRNQSTAGPRAARSATITTAIRGFARPALAARTRVCATNGP